MELQRKLKNARKRGDIDRVAVLVKEIQDPALKLTEFEQEYSDWVLDLYREKIRIDEIKAEIKKYAKELKEAKSGEPISWGMSERYTKLCALRAAMRGKMHFSVNTRIDRARYELGLDIKDFKYNAAANSYEGILDLDVQKEWVDEIAEEFVEEPEEFEEFIPKKIETSKKISNRSLWKKIADKAKEKLNEIF
jgi:hypothetical protein